jgi:PAS domain S-box-containing protein
MEDKTLEQRSATDLRHEAEKKLAHLEKISSGGDAEDIQKLVHELQVHQIELEMQNEELRRVQNDLEISRSRYADLYDFAPVGYLTLNKHGQIVDLNLTAARQLGIERGRLVNKNFQYFVFKPDKKEFLSHLNALFDKHERQITEVRLSPRDGKQFFVRLESIYWELERDAGLCRINMSDVSLLKKERQKANYLSSIVQSSDDAIIGIEINGIITSWNRGSENIYGYAESEVIGKPISILHPPEREEEMSQILGKIKLGEHISRYETIRRRKDGKTINVSVTVSPIRDTEGKIVAASTIGRNITERKRAGEELRKAHDELELRVTERTAALEKANEELQQIPSKLIAVLEEERKRLASELHDSIGQTLAAVKFWVEMALKLKDAGDGNAALNHLEQFVPILQRSIEETRSIYMGLRPSMLDSQGLLATLEWLRQECMKLYPERHIELEAGIAEEAIPKNLKVNIFRIAQEALNNIAKHSKAEWVDISLSKNGGEIELVVFDDGMGMAPELILQASTARSLGLTSMRERAELTGGSFSIESTPGKGTTIRACWPIQAEDYFLKDGITQ